MHVSPSTAPGIPLSLSLSRTRLQIQTLCVSPDGTLLLSIDEDGRALLINKKRRALLHHFSFKGPVATARFSPDGRYIAAAVGRLVQVGPCTQWSEYFSHWRWHVSHGWVSGTLLAGGERVGWELGSAHA